MHQGRITGVMALYRYEKDAFAADELVSLLEPCPAIASILWEMDDDPSGFEERVSTERAHVTLNALEETELLVASR
jgi:hypothetical protein